MNFKEYDNFINNHKYDMLYFIIYYNLKCNENLQLDIINLENKPNIKKQINLLIDFIYNTYRKDEQHLDLGCICDKAVEYKNEILNHSYNEFENKYNFTYRDLLERCYNEL